MNWDEPKTIYVAVALGLVALRYLFELWLDHLNTRHVKKHANAIPEPFKEIMDEQTYQKSVRYTLAKARFSTMSDTYSTVLVIGLLFFGTIAIVFNSISISLGVPLCPSDNALGCAMALLFAGPALFLVFAVQTRRAVRF